MQKYRLVHCPFTSFLPSTSSWNRDKIVVYSASDRTAGVLGATDGVHCVTTPGDTVDPSARVLLLIGSESAECAGTEPVALLFASVQQALSGCSRRPVILVQGGMASPEAAAAYLMTGADGVVLESLHWLTDGSAASAEARSRLSGLRVDHTRIIGQRLGTPRRFFDKGNSRAVRELEALCDALSVSGEAGGEAFVHEVAHLQVAPFDASFSPDEIIPLGPEAAYAREFVDRFGSATNPALDAFAEATAAVMSRGEEFATAFSAGPAAGDLGTQYALLQGAMTWITDSPAFARAVAEAGALPTLALGSRDRAQLDRDFADLRRIMGDLPYAMNILVLEENRFRDEQLAWLEAHRPPFVVIAAGDPSFAEGLKKNGQRVIYLCPDEGLLRLALQAGVDFVVLEGTEAGGHVGVHSTQMLAQMALSLRRRDPQLFRNSHVVLAGGIFDRASALRAAILGAEALQMGTAYLTTREIVDTGALPALYQRLILEAAPGGTVVSGETVGLRVRSLKTPRMDSIRELERSIASAGADEQDFRQRLEALSIGTLLIASRHVRRPGEAELDETVCLEEGQYMSGAVAGCLQSCLTLQELHRELVDGPFAFPAPGNAASSAVASGPAIVTSSSLRERPERIAITGFALANSLGRDEDSFWKASLAMRSGVCAVPDSRWDHARYFDADPRARNKTYSPIGAFMDMPITRRDLWVSPQDFRTMAYSMRLSLLLAERAIARAGLDRAGIAPERVSIIVSQNSGEAAGALQDQILFTHAEEIAALAADVLDATPEQIRRLADAIRQGRPGVDDTTLIGRLNCTAAGHISNRYGFMGPSYSVGAACATSLVALHAAVMMIRQGVIDAAVVGGGEEPLTPTHYLEFSALGALAGRTGRRSRVSEYSRPFNADRDGFVMGEGGAMLVVERESVARARGATPLAYITGVGAANNDKGIVESVAESQVVALNLSFQDAGYGPDEVDLIECHATSTVQGDHEEVKALRTLYPAGSKTTLAAVKSQIGHTLGASGITAIGRAIMAMRDGILPATLNAGNLDPRLCIAEHGFRVPTAPEAWPDRSRPRRAQVDAFGFGGASFVFHLEGAEGMRRTAVVPERVSEERPLGVHALSPVVDGQPWRAAVLADTPAAAMQAFEAILPLPAADESRALAALARAGVHAGPAVPAPATACVLSGQGGFYPGMGRELYDAFPVVRSTLDRLAAVAEFDLLDILFQADASVLRRTGWQQPALFSLELAIATQLTELGFRPAALAGHSLGELTALTLAGVMSPEDGFRVVCRRGRCMEEVAATVDDPGIMIATDAPAAIVERLTGRFPGVVITNFNSGRQTVFGGDTNAAGAMRDTLVEQGFRCTELAVSMAFHSPIMVDAGRRFAEFLETITIHSPRIPVISNVTSTAYPDDPDAIRELMARHLSTGVHWTGNVETLWLDHAVRCFVEVGPGPVLCGLINDVFEQAACVPTCTRGSEAATLRAALASLHVRGLLHLPLPDGDGPAVVQTGAREEGLPVRQPSGLSTDIAGGAGVLEEVIAIIMDATGYERSEIEPDMDIRQDLAIRSSRLPVIMDEAEKRFGIVIRIEDFIGVDTVRDMAERIAGLSGLPVENADDPGDDTLEEVIAIIMDTTGYERAEIEPDMDIRQDLAIRSSRLPVIMDEAEKRFDIVIRIEDFLGVNTVRDMSERIAQLRTGSRPLPAVNPAPAPAAAAGPENRTPVDAVEPVSRLVPVAELLGQGAGLLPELPAGSCVAVLQLEFSTGWDRDVAAEAARLLACETVCLPLEPGCPDAVIRHLPAGLSGLIFVVDGEPDSDVGLQLLVDAFAVLQHFLKLSGRTFVLGLHGLDENGDSGMVAEGLTGMLQVCRLEYASLLLRSVGLDRSTTLDRALTRALDTAPAPVQMDFVHGEARSWRMTGTGVVPARTPAVAVGRDDVIIVSGGARGVTRQVALGLAVHAPQLILLGRSRPDQNTAACLAELQAAGARAEYLACDVTDASAVHELIREVTDRYGRIDGIIHGAGILNDNLAVKMNLADFTSVLRVKADGLRHLVNAASGSGLRFVTGFSSVAAWQGNVGQVAYCTANRAMSALLRRLAGRGTLAACALWLPPIEGAGGMADDPDTRELMRRKGLDRAFVHVEEFRELFLRELACGVTDSPWVMLSRPLPDTDTVLPAHGEEDGAERLAWGTRFPVEEMPMIDSLREVDLRAGTAVALRVFRQDFDLWLPDHRPHPSMANPLVSAVQVIETFLEGARCLLPYRHPVGLRDVCFKDMIFVPEGTPRETRTAYRRDGQDVLAVLEARDVSPSGRPLAVWSPCYEGRVLFGPLAELSGLADLTDCPASFDGPGLSRAELETLYAEKTAQTGRYRIVQRVQGTGPDSIGGTVLYPDGHDFAGLQTQRASYPLYLLEAMMQLALFHDGIRSGWNARDPLPVRIAEIRTGGSCDPGQEVLILCRRREVTERGMLWDAQALDARGRVLLLVQGIFLAWTR